MSAMTTGSAGRAASGPGSASGSASGSGADAPAPPRGRRARRWWIVIGVAVALIGVVGAWLGSSRWAPYESLDPDGRGMYGTRALAEILRDGGVDVIVSRDRAEALRLLTESDRATLVTAGSSAISDETFKGLFDAAHDIVLIDPFAPLDLALSGASLAPYTASELVDPQCSLPEAERSGAIEPGRTFEAPAGATACYPLGDGFGLLVGERTGGGTAAILDASPLFANEFLANEGNAALALNLMGRNETLVWYVPSLLDSDIATPPRTLGDLTPGWVTPSIVLLALAALAAAFWRGRRFGPLVHERLPVTARAAETMEGRSRLYARGRDHVHAADALRIGAIGRLAALLGLGPAADAYAIADAAADLVGAPRGTVRALLVDELPASDAHLLSISDRVRDLEAAVRAAVRDEGRTR